MMAISAMMPPTIIARESIVGSLRSRLSASIARFRFSASDTGAMVALFGTVAEDFGGVETASVAAEFISARFEFVSALSSAASFTPAGRRTVDPISSWKVLRISSGSRPRKIAYDRTNPRRKVLGGKFIGLPSSIAFKVLIVIFVESETSLRVTPRRSRFSFKICPVIFILLSHDLEE